MRTPAKILTSSPNLNSFDSKMPGKNIWYILCCSLVFFVLAGLSGCETSGSGQRPQISTESTPIDEAERQLWLAKRALPEDRAGYLLRALDIYLGREDLDSAQQTIGLLQNASMTTLQYEQFALLAAKQAMLSNDPARAAAYFANAPLDAYSSAPLEIQLAANDLRAEALLASGSPLQAARLRIFNAGLYSGETYWENHDLIWRALRNSPSLALSKALETAEDYAYQGWLELIMQIRQNQFSLEQQLAGLLQWQEAWPDHPAAKQLPAELAMLSRLPEMRPRKMALLLPLSGPLARAGAAVRDGFLAAYFRDSTAIQSNTEIQIFDVESYSSVTDLYLELQLELYDLVIGPLQKRWVEELAQFPEFSPPVLALNYQDQKLTAVNGLYEFGLSAEDELNQILDLLSGQVNQRIAAIYPDTAWAQKLIPVLQARTAQAQLPAPKLFSYIKDDNLSEGVAQLLGTQESKERARELQGIVGKLEYEPRRRADIDAVVLLTPPEDARQIKPLLAFHYGSGIPVYGSSRIYSGIARPDKNHDLDDVLYTEIPWLVNQTSPLREDVNYLAGANNFERLYALGVDAYQLAPRLELMAKFPESQLQGVTGMLRINEHAQIRRTLEWATFVNGKVNPKLSLNRHRTSLNL